MKQRDASIDIMKGILIICVVVGHTTLKIPYICVFWFHMPAFFMISGFLCKSLRLTRNDILKKIYRLVIPYFAYSILFYLLMRPEGLVKNILRTIYAGAYNVTVLTNTNGYLRSSFYGSSPRCSLCGMPGQYLCLGRLTMPSAVCPSC